MDSEYDSAQKLSQWKRTEFSWILMPGESVKQYWCPAVLMGPTLLGAEVSVRNLKRVMKRLLPPLQARRVRTPWVSGVCVSPNSRWEMYLPFIAEEYGDGVCSFKIRLGSPSQRAALRAKLAGVPTPHTCCIYCCFLFSAFSGRFIYCWPVTSVRNQRAPKQE